MFISKVISSSVIDKEFEVYVTDGAFTVLCYIFPGSSDFLNRKISFLSGYGVEHICMAEERMCHVAKLKEYFAYSITGYVESVSNQIIMLGNIKIQLDYPLPGGILRGDYVTFSVVRLDVVWQSQSFM